jgi:uncharacterized protein (TIGR02996 family)
MTDETALLKAIQAAPADDAPRLVYADWLDERSDPRGAVVREEVRAAEEFRCVNAGAALKLRHAVAAENLDWFLSVARPPAGVCTPVRFTRSGDAVTPEQLDQASRKAGISLPRDYRAFLLLHNGGVPMPNRFEALEVGEVPMPIEVIHPFKPEDGFTSVLEWYDQHVEDDEHTRVMDQKHVSLFGSMLPVGVPEMDEDCLAISVAAERFGAILYVPYIEGLRRPARVADSFAEFLAMLKDDRPEGIRLATSGDAEGMARWLHAGGNPFMTDPRSGYSVMDHVITGNQVEVLKVILDRKPRFNTATAERVYKQLNRPPCNFPEIRKLIEEYWGGRWPLRRSTGSGPSQSGGGRAS